ncbi:MULTISPECIES: PRD domain-containing protein [unclassified Clostridioides]|uniref:PRD domain-containing protein n=1 Tax=unclassified Clostridioides TaxID=2635829 RepID=UPI001D0C3890|nr:PRD domain-containing protein [Clostridioides sp. ES-S-0049-03]MCC0674367.1 PRD domain-containing protein [Clostridioides sp. ES-S-0145-01]MCC0678088.1 PRD domain-containing protein [Clostridioides sp. ES-W-0018-02]MCC0712598.1 PRD domain-containing protein [Clostridioides sp. ES-W-0017-02]MCC0764100.1 PRD domain-containing protein [Clostridioides sp. ES-S-0006-03]UDN62366.1 PRD domain-containing protein [Clostridioides sp. ES-W-0016-02]
MYITKVLNNSLLLAKDDNDEEIILMGKGIGHNYKIGSELNKEDIEKTFVLHDENIKKSIVQLASEIDAEYFGIAQMIISYGIEKYNLKLMNHIYLALTDHIAFAVRRFKEGIMIENYYLFEIKEFNPKEYDIGKYAITVFKEVLGLDLPEEEIGNIAGHFINAQQDNPYSDRNKRSAKIVNAILQIVHYHFSIVYNKESFYYMRFVMHLKAFSQRFLANEPSKEKIDFIYNQVRKNCKEEYECVKKIGAYIHKEYSRKLPRQEELYLMIHIHKILGELDENC